MSTRQRLLVWVDASATLMIVGAFGPWVTVQFFGIEVSGTDSASLGWLVDDGWLVVGAAVVGAGLFTVTRQKYTAGLWAVVGGIAGAFVTIHDWRDASSDDIAQIGWGLKLATIASLSFAVAGLVWFRQMKAATVAGGAPIELSQPAEPDAELDTSESV